MISYSYLASSDSAYTANKDDCSAFLSIKRNTTLPDEFVDTSHQFEARAFSIGTDEFNVSITSDGPAVQYFDREITVLLPSWTAPSDGSEGSILAPHGPDVPAVAGLHLTINFDYCSLSVFYDWIAKLIKNFMNYASQLTRGETQLRAKRTRIKILRAIADRNGTAGFSDIKVSTGLSTGSIYYHLERMGIYVTKDSKQYLITEEGLRLLRNVDPKYSQIEATSRPEEPSQKMPEECSRPVPEGDGEQTFRQIRAWGRSSYALAGAVAVVILLVAGATQIASKTPSLFIFYPNASAVLSVGIAFAAAVSILILLRRRYHPRFSLPIPGPRGLLISISFVAVFASIIMGASQFQFTGAAEVYDNSMDALLSSYSLHWQIR